MPAASNGKSQRVYTGTPYWQRLTPAAEYEYRDQNGRRIAEIVVWDDRQIEGDFKVQFFGNLPNERRAKGGTFRVPEADAVRVFDEIAQDLRDYAASL